MTIVIVAGALANKPLQGGSAWVRLSWLCGLQRLGFDVHFVEQISSDACVDAAGARVDFEESLNRAYFRRVMSDARLDHCSTLVLGEAERVEGVAYDRVLDVAAEAALLVNISGHLTDDAILRRIRSKAYLDLDPGFTQFWETAGIRGSRLAGHDAYFTIGENIGQPGCPIPTGGIDWRPTRQPVVLEDWPPADGERLDRFTTVGSWRGPYGPIEHDGRTLGIKAHEFRKVVELPSRVGHEFELALEIHAGDTKDRSLLEAHGWRLVDPRTVAASPVEFREYVQGSGAEFSVAQGVYVETDSGWFSDRTVRYLASGKPALVQETGFSRAIPSGDGVVPFRTLEDAIAGAERIAADYAHHSGAARVIAEEWFDSDRVVTEFLEKAGISP